MNNLRLTKNFYGISFKYSRKWLPFGVIPTTHNEKLTEKAIFGSYISSCVRKILAEKNNLT